jgi:hypothetical protein
MVLSIHQPSYFPWLGLLHKIARSDVYMVMDEVQLTDSAYQHRNLFLTADGKAKFLTIPFNKKNYLRRLFKDLEITDPEWGRKHFNFLSNSYGKHPYYRVIMPAIEAFFARQHETLVEAVVESMMLSMECFGIRTKVIFQSQMAYDRNLKRGDLVVALVRAAGADCYLSGTGAQSYLDEGAFRDGLALQYDHFSHPVYPQRNTPDFIPGLSCLDVLFNVGRIGGSELLHGTVMP